MALEYLGKRIVSVLPIMSSSSVRGARGCGLKAPSTAPAATRHAPTTPRKSTHSLRGGRPQQDLGALPSPSEHAYAAPLPDLKNNILLELIAVHLARKDETDTYRNAMDYPIFY